LVRVYRDGVEVGRTVSRCDCASWNRDCSDISDDSLCYDRSEVLVDAKEDGLCSFLDEVGGELGCLYRSVDKRGIVLDNGLVLQWVHEDNLGIDKDAVSNDERDVAKVIWQNRSRDKDKTLFSIDNESIALFVHLGEAI